jgi:hypothetical protein
VRGKFTFYLGEKDALFLRGRRSRLLWGERRELFLWWRRIEFSLVNPEFSIFLG